LSARKQYRKLREKAEEGKEENKRKKAASPNSPVLPSKMGLLYQPLTVD
jgi:hypothetical protein